MTTKQGKIAASLAYMTALGTAAIATVDVWLAATARATISARILAASRETPLVPALLGLAAGLVVGILAGHLFWPQKG